MILVHCDETKANERFLYTTNEHATQVNLELSLKITNKPPFTPTCHMENAQEKCVETSIPNADHAYQVLLHLSNLRNLLHKSDDTDQTTSHQIILALIFQTSFVVYNIFCVIC